MSKQTRKRKNREEDEDRIQEEFQFRPERTQRMTREQCLKRHPKFNPETARVKVRISIELDQDVLEFFQTARRGAECRALEK